MGSSRRRIQLQYRRRLWFSVDWKECVILFPCVPTTSGGAVFCRMLTRILGLHRYAPEQIVRNDIRCHGRDEATANDKR